MTAPLLITDDATLCDSWDIARYADAHGVSSKLLPDERIAEDRQAFNGRANTAMTAGRILLVRALLESPGALDESLPTFVPRLGAALDETHDPSCHALVRAKVRMRFRLEKRPRSHE